MAKRSKLRPILTFVGALKPPVGKEHINSPVEDSYGVRVTNLSGGDGNLFFDIEGKKQNLQKAKESIIKTFKEMGKVKQSGRSFFMDRPIEMKVGDKHFHIDYSEHPDKRKIEKHVLRLNDLYKRRRELLR